MQPNYTDFSICCLMLCIFFTALPVPNLACGPTTPHSTPAVKTCSSCRFDQLTLTPAIQQTAHSKDDANRNETTIKRFRRAEDDEETTDSSLVQPILNVVSTGQITLDIMGCRNLMVICTGYHFALLQFNNMLNGPPISCIHKPTSSCTANLVCNSFGQWTFTDNDVTTEISVVACQNL